jgi:hypothetical protein
MWFIFNLQRRKYEWHNIYLQFIQQIISTYVVINVKKALGWVALCARMRASLHTNPIL